MALEVETVETEDAEVAIALPFETAAAETSTPPDSATRITWAGGEDAAPEAAVSDGPDLVFPPSYHSGTSPAMSTLYRQMRQLPTGTTSSGASRARCNSPGR